MLIRLLMLIIRTSPLGLELFQREKNKAIRKYSKNCNYSAVDNRTLEIELRFLCTHSFFYRFLDISLKSYLNSPRRNMLMLLKREIAAYTETAFPTFRCLSKHDVGVHYIFLSKTAIIKIKRD